MSFLYFIAGGNSGFNLARAREQGLGYAFERGLSVREILNGPGGLNGIVVADHRFAGELGYFSDRQTWRKLPGGDNRVGFRNDARPTATDLARVDRLAGHEVLLLDEQPWLVPIARGWAEEDGELRWYYNVPVVADVDENGQWTRTKIVARYAAFWDLTCRWDDARRQAAAAALANSDEGADGAVTVRFDFGGTMDAAITVLQQNYRLGRIEAAMLELLTEEKAIEILGAACDMPTRQEFWAKKAAARAGSSS